MIGTDSSDDDKISNMNWHDYPADLFKLIADGILKSIKNNKSDIDENPHEIWYEEIEEMVLFEIMPAYHFKDCWEDITKYGPNECVWRDLLIDRYEELTDGGDFEGFDTWSDDTLIEATWWVADSLSTENWDYRVPLSVTLYGFSQYLNISFYDNYNDRVVMDAQVPLFIIDSEADTVTIPDEHCDQLIFLTKSNYFGRNQLLKDSGINPDNFTLYTNDISERAYAIGKGDLRHLCIRIQ